MIDDRPREITKAEMMLDSFLVGWSNADIVDVIKGLLRIIKDPSPSRERGGG